MERFSNSLILQFPSQITGNAAAGVQVAVKITGTNTLATLYATNNTAGATKSNPTTTDPKGFYSFYAADGKYTLEFNNGFPSIDMSLLDSVQWVSDTESGSGLLGQAASAATQSLNVATSTLNTATATASAAIVTTSNAVANVTAAADEAIAVEIPAQIASLGLEYPPIAYTAGLTLDSYTKTYSEAGALYIWGGTLGAVTTGSFDESGWQPIQGDIQLRNDVQQGTSLIRDVKHVASVTALRALPGVYDGQVVERTSYIAGESSGSDRLVWRSAAANADDDIKWFAVAGVATGRWELLTNGFVTPEMAGASINGVDDCTDAFDKVRAAGYRPYLSSGVTYNVTYTSAADLLDVEGKGIVTNGFITIYAEELEGSLIELEEQQATPVGPTIRRMRSTHSDLELFVDATVVSSGNGSQLSPLKSINEALAFVPREIYHKVRIYLADGLYDGDDNYFSLYNYFVTPWSGAGLQIIGHIPENPLYADTDLDAVVLGNSSGAADTDNFVIGGVIGDTDDTKIAGVTFDARVQIYGCNFAFDRTKHKTGKNGELVGGHGGRVKFSACNFSDCDTFFAATDLAHFFINLCTVGIPPTTAVVEARNGSFVMFEGSAAIATSAVIVREGNSIVMVDNGMVSTGSSGATKGTQEFALVGPAGQNLQHVNSVGSTYAGGVFVSGRPAAPTLPTADSFTFFMTNDGSVFIKAKFGGVEKQVKVWDFTTNTVQ